ncbi:hypothetical protein BKH41_03890 [Helicobacter sp. 12S02232-10]|uniref:phage baseplate assembly protein V n=1 Tax=Helicobacter sp. 12S02232-10 TaxID=1476197 RepID=UPI000BDA408E|nr:phage baseplate assembly protein V [Helicobacter sp. 12S02232-10]PAF49230.1 hypothetical protein BKH41_03890 [Helicobacter sp. 12S02232-10]
MFGEVSIYIAPITQVQGNQVKVDIVGTKTDFMTYLSTNNPFKSQFIPPQVGENALIFHFKESDLFLCMGSIPKPNPELSANKEVITYKDGTTLSYDSGSHTLEIQSKANITINCKQAQIQSDDVKIECKSADIKADSINLGDTGGGGVITTQSICPFTGSPHTQGSNKVKAIL